MGGSFNITFACISLPQARHSVVPRLKELVNIYLKIAEEISFNSKDIIFNDAVIIDLVSFDGVK